MKTVMIYKSAPVKNQEHDKIKIMWMVNYIARMAKVYGTSPKEFFWDFVRAVAVILFFVSVMVVCIIFLRLVTANANCVPPILK
jgi:hypothetical protein